MSCKHPPARLFSGMYSPATPPASPYRRPKDEIDDKLWVACCDCGEIIRQAPAALRDEAAWKAQRAGDG